LGLEGHSDGDVVCHALADAILGAAGLGDIGRHFPDDDPRYENASSIELLTRVVELLSERTLRVHNADVTVVLEVPRLGPYREQMISNLAGALKIPEDSIGLKAKTNDKLGDVGRGEAIAALAVALVDQA